MFKKCTPLWREDPGLNFYYGVENPFCTKASKFLTSAIIKWWFSTPRGLRKMTTWYCYKMKIGFYHEVTWRGNSTTTKWRLVFIIKLLEGDTPPLQNEDWFLYAFIIRLLEGKTSILQNDDWKWLESMRFGFHMLPSEGQLTLLQNEIGFLHVAFRWANSLATKWLSIFKGLSTTETLKTHKMQFPSSGYKMPGPSPFFHLNLSLERPWNRAQGLPFCSWNSNGDARSTFQSQNVQNTARSDHFGTFNRATLHNNDNNHNNNNTSTSTTTSTSTSTTTTATATTTTAAAAATATTATTTKTKTTTTSTPTTTTPSSTTTTATATTTTTTTNTTTLQYTTTAAITTTTTTTPLGYTTLHSTPLHHTSPHFPITTLQLQPAFSPSVDSLCHPWFTTTNLSYRFPISETSATALCGSTGICEDHAGDSLFTAFECFWMVFWFDGLDESIPWGRSLRRFGIQRWKPNITPNIIMFHDR